MLLAAYIARRRVMTSSHASLRRPPPSMPLAEHRLVRYIRAAPLAAK